MTTARDVANHFLILAEASGEDGEALTHLKLQKLLYYAQGFHLAIYGRPLFADCINAWGHGPVVRSIYDQFKQYGRSPLPVDMSNDPVLTQEQSDLLNDVWNTYGQFSAWKLREMTHIEPPWRDAYLPGQNVEIDHTALTQYFCTQLA